MDTPFPQDADLPLDDMSSDEDSEASNKSDADSDEDSDELELMREYAKIKKERE